MEGGAPCAGRGRAHTCQPCPHYRLHKQEGPAAQHLACSCVTHRAREAPCTTLEVGEAQASHPRHVSPEALHPPSVCTLHRLEGPGKTKPSLLERGLSGERPALATLRRQRRLNPCGPAAAAAAQLLQSCPTLRPHGWQPTRLLCPRDSLGNNTGMGCHFLLQCMHAKSLQSCPTLCDPMDSSPLASSVHGIL